MRMQRPLFKVPVLIFLLMALFFLIACAPAAPAPTGETTDTATAEPAAEGTPKQGGTLRVAYVFIKTDIDVQSANTSDLNEVAAYFYETLFDRMQSGEIVGLLAKEWEVSEDGLVHTWKLQPGVKFHDGSDFNAEVVKWNIDRKVTNKKPLADSIPFANVEVIDELTVQVTLTRPAPGMYGVLAAKPWSMYSPSFVEEVGDEAMKSQASGTGPFMVKEYIPNDTLHLERNPNYWQAGLPYLDELIFQNVPDINTRATMLEAGDVDMAFDLAIQDVERLKSNTEFTVLEEVGSRQWYITMNNVKAPLDDVKVRQAINHAVDKEGIIQAVYLGKYATIARAVYLMPTIDGYHDAGVYEYDVEKAAALLEEAGWVDGDGDGVREKDGEPLSINLYTRKGSAAGDIEIAELVQGMLKEVGISVEINILDSAAFLSTVTKPAAEAEYDLVNLSVGVFTGDGEYIMQTFYACASAAPVYYNRAYFCDEEVDALIEESMAAPNLEARNAIYADVIQRVFEQAPILQLFDIVQIVATSNKVKGVYFEPAGNNWPGKYAWLEE